MTVARVVVDTKSVEKHAQHKVVTNTEALAAYIAAGFFYLGLASIRVSETGNRLVWKSSQQEYIKCSEHNINFKSAFPGGFVIERSGSS